MLPLLPPQQSEPQGQKHVEIHLRYLEVSCLKAPALRHLFGSLKLPPLPYRYLWWGGDAWETILRQCRRAIWALTDAGGCKWTEIGEKVLSLVEAAVTRPQEKLLSSEMNLLNNLCLMGLSIISCFYAHLYFSLFHSFAIISVLSPRLFILSLPRFLFLLLGINTALKTLNIICVFTLK